MITWLKFQHLIGAATTATAWNSDQQAMKTTTEQIRYHLLDCNRFWLQPSPNEI